MLACAASNMAEHIVEAPAPGRVLRVQAREGATIAEGDRICVLEALKMELPIVSPVDGTVKTVPIAVGQTVEAGDTLAVIEA